MGAENEYGGKSMMGKSICAIIGTRPEIIKMSPVVRACEGSGAGVVCAAYRAALVLWDGSGVL